MANEIIEIARLDLDTSALIKSTATVKTQLDDLKKRQSELTKIIKEGGEGAQEASEEYVRNAVSVNEMSKSYRDSIKAIEAQNKALDDSEEATKLVTLAQNKEIASINEARANVALLTRVRNETNTSTEEGRQRLKDLNDAINANNDYIQDNADEYLKLKLNVGNYTEAIQESFNSVNIFNGGLGGFISRAGEAGGAGNLLTGAFTGIIAGLRGMITAGIAFIATPIGAVITAIALAVGVVVGAFKFMVDGMKKTEAGSNKLAKVTALFSGALTGLSKIVQPLAEFLFDVFVGALDAVIAVGEKVIDTFKDVARFIGLDAIADGVEAIEEAVKKNVVATLALEMAEQKLQKMQRDGIALQLQYQNIAEKLRQERDDESKSTEERILANRALGILLKEQGEAELALAKQKLAVAMLALKANYADTEALDAKAEAMREIIDIQERITGQVSEQLANENSLRKEQADKEKERVQTMLNNALKLSSARLELFRSEQGIRIKELDDQLAYEEKIRDMKIKVAQDEYKASEKTASDKLRLQTNINNANNELLKAQADATIAQAQREVDIYRKSIEQRIEDNKFLTDSLLSEKLNEQDRLLQLELDYQAKRREQGQISEQAYLDTIAEIQREDAIKRDELQKERALAEEERKLLDLENRRVAEADIFNADLEIQAEQNAIKLAQELAEAEKNGADKAIIQAKYAKIEQDREKAVQENKLALANETFGAIGGLLKEQSLLGKAFALFQIGIDTQQAIVKALASAPPPYNYILAGAVGLKGAISATKVAGAKFENGGVQEIGGKRHVAGGVNFYGEDGTTFNAEQGELIGVMNRNASSQFLSFNDAFRNGSKNSFSGGSSGILSQSVNTNQDLTPIAGMIIQAVGSMPSPIVTVEDINLKQSETVRVISNGDLF